MSLKIKDLPDEELFTSGHTACAGCGGAIAARVVMKVLGRNTVVYNPACCLLVFGGTYPNLAWKVPYHHVAFENTGACITGMKRALNKLGKEDVTVLGMAGDGGTADIGLQALSGAAERNEDVLYVCYDNEAYMNTGIQRSGSTPYGASTTTTPVGSEIQGKEEYKKDVALIMMAHRVPYVATASIGHPQDLLRKLEKARDMKGFRYLQIFAPCPTGWKAAPNTTVRLPKLAVDCGMWTLWEAENGKLKINKGPRIMDGTIASPEEYLKLQGRFRHFSDKQVANITKWAKEKWEYLQQMEWKE